MSGDDDRPARIEDVHEPATAMPDVVVGGDADRPGSGISGPAFVAQPS